MRLPIPTYSYENLRKRAAAFLRQHHPEGTIPVSIEQIVEFRFNINIIPLPGWLNVHDADAFLSSDLKSLVVDMGIGTRIRSRS